MAGASGGPQNGHAAEPWPHLGPVPGRELSLRDVLSIASLRTWRVFFGGGFVVFVFFEGCCFVVFVFWGGLFVFVCFALRWFGSVHYRRLQKRTVVCVCVQPYQGL